MLAKRAYCLICIQGHIPWTSHILSKRIHLIDNIILDTDGHEFVAGVHEVDLIDPCKHIDLSCSQCRWPSEMEEILAIGCKHFVTTVRVPELVHGQVVASLGHLDLVAIHAVLLLLRALRLKPILSRAATQGVVMLSTI